MKVSQAWQNALMRNNFFYDSISKCHNFMLVYLAGPQTFLHLCKISDKVTIYRKKTKKWQCLNLFFVKNLDDELPNIFLDFQSSINYLLSK